MLSKTDNTEVLQPASKDKIKQVQVLERARRILRTLADCPNPISLHEISEMTEIHMSTVHRLLWNLAQDGLVDRMSNGRWRLGLTFLEYGSLVRDRLDIREKAIGVMQLLFERTGQTINLAIRRNDSIMYIEHVYAPGTGIRLARRIGAMAPLHCTSGGKLFLSDMTPEEVATLASIVEEETNNNAEKPTVAGLYINRLHKDMPLQADPTVKFALQDFQLKRISNKHLTVDSPYNTYRNIGLPPGPIRIPTPVGIDAVLNYEKHDYIYMCAKEDFSGTHNFASNYTEHMKNARKYWKALNERKIFK